MSDSPCPFCDLPADRMILQNPVVYAMWDGYPVSPGHVLVVTRRHVAGWAETTAAERDALWRAVELARAEIEKHHSPDGYNVGINDGAAAGQTIFHLHLHVIPRYEGDVEDPRGGIRHVIAAKADYWSG